MDLGKHLLEYRTVERLLPPNCFAGAAEERRVRVFYIRRKIRAHFVYRPVSESETDRFEEFLKTAKQLLHRIDDGPQFGCERSAVRRFLQNRNRVFFLPEAVPPPLGTPNENQTRLIGRDESARLRRLALHVGYRVWSLHFDDMGAVQNLWRKHIGGFVHVDRADYREE